VTAHNTIIRKLLFEAATFHGLAKLRLHTETTVTELENSLTRLGDALRAFQQTVCPAYKTAELPTEEAARIRRQANAAKKTSDPKGKAKASNHAAGSGAAKGKAKANPTAGGGGRRQRTYNLNTYKVHALGGYAKAIRKYGSMDNYNSQTVCMYDIFVLRVLIMLLGRTGTSAGKTDIQNSSKGPACCGDRSPGSTRTSDSSIARTEQAPT